MEGEKFLSPPQMPGYDANLLHDVKCFQAVYSRWGYTYERVTGNSCAPPVSSKWQQNVLIVMVLVASRYFSLANLCNTFNFVVYNSMEHILYDSTIYRVWAT